MGKLADIIYEELCYMYCDNCRYEIDSIDEFGTDRCEDCHRKYNGWGVSKETAEAIERKYLEKIKAESEEAQPKQTDGSCLDFDFYKVKETLKKDDLDNLIVDHTCEEKLEQMKGEADGK